MNTPYEQENDENELDYWIRHSRELQYEIDGMIEEIILWDVENTALQKENEALKQELAKYKQ